MICGGIRAKITDVTKIYILQEWQKISLNEFLDVRNIPVQMAWTILGKDI